jgi:hypothetical protein
MRAGIRIEPWNALESFFILLVQRAGFYYKIYPNSKVALPYMTRMRKNF